MCDLQRCHVIYGSPSHDISLRYGSHYHSLILVVCGRPRTFLIENVVLYYLMMAFCIAMDKRGLRFVSVLYWHRGFVRTALSKGSCFGSKPLSVT